MLPSMLKEQRWLLQVTRRISVFTDPHRSSYRKAGKRAAPSGASCQTNQSKAKLEEQKHPGALFQVRLLRG